MNYPIWDLPASGLLIAFVGIVHVFVSHFAVGGGLFLVLTERKARREHDQALLDYLVRHSRFFILLTLVFGAITGVGIWFTIGLVHPAATSSLINTFVWYWAIEWTFFVTEIAAALVYYYGWSRLPARAHMVVGWIYVIAAWMSLVVINGILTYMMTPGEWVTTRLAWDGFLNPTSVPAVAARTFAAVGLAGLYALLTISWQRDAALQARLARYAGLWWVVPMAVAVPISLVWYLSAAAGAGVPVAEIFGAAGHGVTDIARAIVTGADSGYPTAQRAALVSLAASLGALVLTLAAVFLRPRTFGRGLTAALMICGLLAIGGAEWTREDLRKPYVLGGSMFVNGIRLPAPPGTPGPPGGAADSYAIDVLNASGVLPASRWIRAAHHASVEARIEADGRAVFRLLCSSCHTTDGYLAIRPLVRGRSAAALNGVLGQLAVPVTADGHAAAWSDPHLRLRTFRHRRMPPLAGTDDERQALAVYLARLGGAAPSAETAPTEAGDDGRQYFEENCSACHGPDAQWPFKAKGRSAATFYEMIGRLPEVNDIMPSFEGTDEERRALAAHLATLGTGSTREAQR